MAQWMIYGANGYTGDLIAREAVKRGHRPILAGRNADAIQKLAKELDCESRVFDLDAINLGGADLVLHCAGPFSQTSAPMVQACIGNGVHYLDITGEIAVFEAVMRRDAEARQKGITLIPGVGFDVVPTDCLAAMLKDRMPDASELWLAIHWKSATLSPGTLKTMIDGAGAGSAIRKDGVIVRVPPAYDVREIPFEQGPRKAMTIAWGDVSTAFYTTGIPNIRVYAAAAPKAIARARRTRYLAPLLRLGFVKKALQKMASRRKGPNDEQRAKGQIHLWGRVANAKGEEITMTLTVAEGYTFTAKAAIAALERVLAEPVQPGATTPARRFGAGFVNQIG